MSISIEDVDRFITGTVGLPGEREFYFQIKSHTHLISVATEKSQAAALSERLEALLRSVIRENTLLMPDITNRDVEPLEQPITSDFQLGAVSLAWDDDKNMVCIEFFSVANVESENEDPEVEFFISIAQARAFVQRTQSVIDAGRLPCPFCGLAIDPRGHLCPRANGYRR